MLETLCPWERVPRGDPGIAKVRGHSIGLFVYQCMVICFSVYVPQKAHIDVLGTLHHIIVRAIKRRKIFYVNQDRDNFLERLGAVLVETGTPCFA